MMQTEQNFKTQNSTPSNAPSGDLRPAMTRTRCPGCQKLFAVETETLNSMARAGVIRAEFTCTTEMCHESFGLDLPLQPEHAALSVIPAVRLTKTPLVANAQDVKPEAMREPIAEPESTPASKRQAPATAVVEAPLRAKSTKSSLIERECPRCGVMNAASLNECARCGIIFDRYLETNEAQVQEELALGGTRELALLWDKVLEDYEDRIRHDRFLNACRDANALSYSSKKYSQILVAAPQDDIARLMRNRIVAMISVRAESSKLPIRLSFRIPKLNSLALFGGTVLFVWGLAMPQLKNIMEIGLSLMLLSIGVRLALRARV